VPVKYDSPVQDHEDGYGEMPAMGMIEIQTMKPPPAIHYNSHNDEIREVKPLIRISGGYLRGRYIKTPPTEITRPALTSVRQAVFNILANDVPGSRFLDLFGGSGAYAIEAVSRGAESATIVDMSRKVASVIESNLTELDLRDKVRLLVADALVAVPRFASGGDVFDVIAVAPPHFSGLVDKAMRRIDSFPGILSSDSVVFVQHHHDEKAPVDLVNLVPGRVYRYGITLVSLYRLRAQ
jgi:16S rRNA (guanine966-N2)-methyltransferase